MYNNSHVMRRYFISSLIFIFSAVTYFFYLGRIPPIFDDASYLFRLQSALSAIGSTIVLFFLAKELFKSISIAQVSSLTFVMLPWVFEQARVASQVNAVLFPLLFCVYMIRVSTKYVWKSVFLALMPVSLFVIYQEFWLFTGPAHIISLSEFSANTFHLLSPDFLFFKNNTFWWGGVRDWGVLHAALLPFFLFGIFKTAERSVGILLLLIVIAAAAAVSPFFPESREFYLSVPILALIISTGMVAWYRLKGRIVKVIFTVLIALYLYELSQFYHYYTVHYPQQVMGNMEKIERPY